MPAPILPLFLARDSGVPLVHQVANQIRDAVSTGGLQPLERLPSIRALAADVGVARAVIEAAYDQLIAEGWLTARRGAGTYVTAVGQLPAAIDRKIPAPALSPTEPDRVRLDTGSPWTDPR
ncbi:MAG: winged helix-turn-helix domain-containing protein, partial [Actinomycetota bacterium]|nr:winged helix-turn-helix domain-containing protein [Actinomycetota bacterium]